MNEEDPYETLNLPRDATQSQIKSAYRKLALKYHPDKQSTTEEKQRCSEIFTKIGNAYEILGDQQRRASFDREGVAATGQEQYSHDPFQGFFSGGSPFLNDPFFNRSHGSTGNSRGFSDPFDIFREVFGSDMRTGFESFHDHSTRNADFDEQRGSHNDPFGMGGFGMMGGMMGGMAHQMGAMSSFPTSSQQTFSSSSSSGGGMRQSVSTTTRIINGKRQTVTERTVVHPDGTVETTSETTGDDDFPPLENDRGSGRFLEGNRSRRK